MGGRGGWGRRGWVASRRWWTSGLGGLARPDDDPAVGLLADARARHLGITLEREVDGPPLERLHRVQRDRVAGHLDLTRRPHRDLADGVLAALTVPLHIDDYPLALCEV